MNKKWIVRGAVVLLCMVGFWFAGTKRCDVYAEETKVLHIDESGDFISEYVEDISVYRGETKSAPSATTKEYEDWLFAGWYKDDVCTPENALRSGVTEGAAWAKFVSPDLLTVKCQVKSDVQEEGVTGTNMRLVTSVDTLNYANVGFEIKCGEDGNAMKCTMDTVFERIKASTKSGVEFQYNPKIVDTDSVYFATATILNISSDAYEKIFLIKPYWQTLDGTRVYGQSRYVKVSDSYENVVNIPVRVNGTAAMDGLTVDGQSVLERRYFEGESYGALMIGVENVTGLPSVTKYTVSDGTVSIHRNLYTTYEGLSGDDSWYKTISDENEFVIVTLSDLYGFAQLVNAGNDFEGKVIYLGADITVNEGDITDWTSVAPNNVWTPIGSTAEACFNGTFDGFLDTIDGIYVNAGDTYAGLFGYVEKDGTVKNLLLENSYYTSNSVARAIGGAIGYLRGNAVNIYAGRDVEVNNDRIKGVTGDYGTGGIVGVFERDGVTTAGTISGCWFAGSVSVKGASGGGILGHAYRGTLNFENCLNTGAITSTYNSGDKYAYAAGLIGGARSWNGFTGLYVNMTDCVNTGSVTATSIHAVGSVMGRSIQTTLTMKNVYTTNDVTSSTGDVTQSDGTVAGIGRWSLTAATVYGRPVVVKAEELYGNSGYISTELDYENVWSAIEKNTPELQLFTEQTTIADFEGLERERTGWYYNAFIPYTKSYTDESGTWYPVVDAQTSFEITTADELRGLRKLVNEGIEDFSDIVSEELSTTISGRTVKLMNDITMYEGEAAEWSEGKNLPSHSWIPIGQNDESQKFGGAFDGQGYTISGVYAVDSVKVEGVFNYLGLFAITAPSSTIKNLKLTNSYFKQEVTDGFVGTIACDIQGKAEALYSNAIVDSYGQQVGGISARVNGLEYEVSGSEETGDLVMGRGSMSMNQCWFDGQIRIKNISRTTYIGGLAGVTVQGTANISNSLFTGTIESISSGYTVYIGGVTGSAMAQSSIGYQSGSESRLNISSCISAGEISAPSGFRGAVVGRVINGISGGKANDTYVTLKNVFATRDCWQQAINVKGNMTSGSIVAKANVTGTTIQTYETDRLIGYCTEENTKDSLDFTNAWSMRVSGVPIPKALESVVDTKTLADTSALTSEIGLDYWNGSLASAVNYGVGNYVVSYSATETTYKEYLKKLEGLGFEKYIDNSASTMDDDGVYNAIYTKNVGDWVLHITYVSGESKIYISINTIGKENLDDNLLSAVQEGTDNVMFSMIQLAAADYGNGFLFRLPNGHFIVIDGGSSSEGANLISYLRALSGDEPVYIDAWVITHFHGDHSAAFNKLVANAALRENVYLEAVYASESSNYSKGMDGGISGQITTADNAYLAAMSLTKADGSKPDVVRMHMGEHYYFNGVTMDVIQAQEQLQPSKYNAYSDPDKFNATSTNCIFTVNKTGDKIYMGGDSTKANMNYIMKAYDGIDANVKRYKDGSYSWYTDTDPSVVTRTQTQTLSDISVFVAFHHGKNTTNAFTRYLVGETDDEYTFDVVMFPFHQMMNPTFYETYVYSGKTYTNCYWMEDESCVFNYKMEEVNEKLLANTTQGFYTYGYEDSVTGSSADNRHGTVELTFTTNGIATNVRKSWKSGFTMEIFE